MKALLASLLAIPALTNVAGASPLDIEKYRAISFDPYGTNNFPVPDPVPTTQAWDIGLQMPQEVQSVIQLAQAAIGFANQLQQPPPQDAVDAINVLTDIASTSMTADAFVEMKGDPSTGTVTAGGMASLRYGGQMPLFASIDGGYNGSAYYVDVVLHDSFAPGTNVDLHLVQANPLKDSSALTNSARLMSFTNKYVSVSVDMTYAANISYDIEPLRADAAIQLTGTLDLTINGYRVRLASDTANATATTDFDPTLFVPQVCGSWHIDNQATALGLDTNAASFSLGDGGCTYSIASPDPGGSLPHR